MKNSSIIVLTFFLVIASIFIANNFGNQCNNPEAEAFFAVHIRNIEAQFQETEIVSGQSMISVLILQKITGIESSVQFGDTSFYDSKADAESDKENWLLWLDKNICQIQSNNLNDVEKDIEIKYHYFKEPAQ